MKVALISETVAAQRARFDVIIAHRITGIVLDTADINLSEGEAQALAERLNAGNLKAHLVSVKVHAETVFPGATVLIRDEELQAILSSRSNARGESQMTRYYDRKARGVCVVCESSNLETGTRCPSCAEKNREASARSTANTF